MAPTYGGSLSAMPCLQMHDGMSVAAWCRPICTGPSCTGSGPKTVLLLYHTRVFVRQTHGIGAICAIRARWFLDKSATTRVLGRTRHQIERHSTRDCTNIDEDISSHKKWITRRITSTQSKSGKRIRTTEYVSMPVARLEKGRIRDLARQAKTLVANIRVDALTVHR